MARFFTRRWLAMHATLIVLCTAFGFLTYWQIGRAAAGNAVSWAYAFEWPLFGLFAIGVWVREIREELRKNGPVSLTEEEAPFESPFERRARSVTHDPSGDDPELSAYNRYLAWARDNPDRRPSEYPGSSTA